MPAAAPVTTMRRDIISSWTGGRADVSVVRGGGPAGATAEERPVAQRGAADVAVAVDAGGGTGDDDETGHHFLLDGWTSGRVSRARRRPGRRDGRRTSRRPARCR